MIRKTLDGTKAATFSVMLPHPDPSMHGFPQPSGTGFFVSPDGWFVTAAHVLRENATGAIRNDVPKTILDKELSESGAPVMVYKPVLDAVIEDADIALLKFDFHENAGQAFLDGTDGFPFLTVSDRLLDEGETVYAFGYPLGSGDIAAMDEQQGFIGHVAHRPRVTSAIVASRIEETQMVQAVGAPPANYVLDKALNYGNSGGPIIAAETGRVHAVCRRFQPVFVPQKHLANESGVYPSVMIPSLYGAASNLGQAKVAQELSIRGITIARD